MTNEEAIRKIVNAEYADKWQGDEELQTAQHMAIDALEAVGNSDKYRCESCKHYDYENNHCFHFDIYCEEDFYCKDWSEE